MSTAMQIAGTRKDGVSMMFEGFTPPTKNFFHMPNEWIDICAGINNLSELKVVQYVLRHTWGYHEYGIPKTISVDEFMHGRKRADGTRMDKGTGLKSDRSVKDGIKAAVDHGYLICEVDTSDQARTKKSYALKMVEDGGRLYPPVETTPGRNYPSEGYNLPLGGTKSTPRSEKDTLEKHFRKKERMAPDSEKSDSFAPSSTHSLSSSSSTSVSNGETSESSVEHLSTISSELSTTVEKQASKPPQTRNTDKLDPLAIYNEQEKQMHQWWRELGLAVKVNLTNKEHWGCSLSMSIALRTSRASTTLLTSRLAATLTLRTKRSVQATLPMQNISMGGSKPDGVLRSLKSQRSKVRLLIHLPKCEHLGHSS